MTIIMPWNAALEIGDTLLLTSAQSYALIIILLTTIYTVKGACFQW